MLEEIEKICNAKLKKAKSCDRVFSDFYIVEIERCRPGKNSEPLCMGRQTFLAVGRECIIPVFPCSAKRTYRALKTIKNFVKKTPNRFRLYAKVVFPLFVFRMKAKVARELMSEAFKSLSKHKNLHTYFIPILETATELVKDCIKKDPSAVAELDNLAKMAIIKSTEREEFRPLALLLVLAEAGVALSFKLLKFDKFMEHIERGEYGVALQIAHEGVLTAVSLKSFTVGDIESLRELIKGADNVMSRRLEVVKDFLEAVKKSMCYAVPEDRENAGASVLPDGTVGIRFGAHVGYVELTKDGKARVAYIDHNLRRLTALAKYLKNVGYNVKERPNDAKIEITVEGKKLKDLFKDLTLTMSVDLLGCYEMFNARNRKELIERKKKCLKEVLGVESLC